MTDIVDRARAALEGVTDGPWSVGTEIDGVRANEPTVVRGPYTGALGNSLRVVTVGQTRTHFGSTRDTKGQDVANVAFIAAARSLIPELTEEVEQLRECVARLQRLVRNPQVVAAIVDPDNPIEVEIQ